MRHVFCLLLLLWRYLVSSVMFSSSCVPHMLYVPSSFLVIFKPFVFFCPVLRSPSYLAVCSGPSLVSVLTCASNKAEFFWVHMLPLKACIWSYLPAPHTVTWQTLQILWAMSGRTPSDAIFWVDWKERHDLKERNSTTSSGFLSKITQQPRYTMHLHMLATVLAALVVDAT